MFKKLFFLIFFISIFSFSQDNIEIRQAGSFLKNELKFPGANILISKNSTRVHLYHEGALIIADSCIFYPYKNFFKASGNVILTQGDTLNLTSNYIEYNGDTKKAITWGDVILEQPGMTLNTDTLRLDRIAKEAFYNTKGKIVDSTNTLTSKKGKYFMQEKRYHFNTDVMIVNPEYTINSKKLDYFLEKKEAYIYGDTKIKGEDYDIFCNEGYYDTKSQKGNFVEDAIIFYDDKIIKGDSLFFDNNKEYASATNNMSITDTINNSIIRGDFGEVFKSKDSAIVTKNAYATHIVEENDSLFIKADTLLITGEKKNRIIRGYYNVGLFKKDLQGKSDSVHLSEHTGITKLLKKVPINPLEALSILDINNINPILWFGRSQLTGNIIHLIANKETKKLDSLKVLENAFFIEKDSIKEDAYNQIKGEFLYGIFEDKEIRRIEVEKNNMVIYYLYNDEGEFIGLDKTLASKMNVNIENNVIQQISFSVAPDGNIFPEKDIDDNDREFKGFTWRNAERPISKKDFFLPKKDSIKSNDSIKIETPVFEKKNTNKNKTSGDIEKTKK